MKIKELAFLKVDKKCPNDKIKLTVKNFSNEGFDLICEKCGFIRKVEFYQNIGVINDSIS